MFGMLEDLTKAVVATAATPVTAVIDTVMVPVDATVDGKVYQRTQKAFDTAGKNFNNAVKPKDEK